MSIWSDRAVTCAPAMGASTKFDRLPVGGGLRGETRREGRTPRLAGAARGELSQAIRGPMRPRVLWLASAGAIGTRSDAQSRPIFYSLPRRRCYARHGVNRPASRHAGCAPCFHVLLRSSMEARPGSSR